MIPRRVHLHTLLSAFYRTFFEGSSVRLSHDRSLRYAAGRATSNTGDVFPARYHREPTSRVGEINRKRFRTINVCDNEIVRFYH